MATVNLEFFLLSNSNLSIRKVSLTFLVHHIFFNLLLIRVLFPLQMWCFLKKTSFIEDRFNILLSVHQVVRILLGGARMADAGEQIANAAENRVPCVFFLPGSEVEIITNLSFLCPMRKKERRSGDFFD